MGGGRALVDELWSLVATGVRRDARDGVGDMDDMIALTLLERSLRAEPLDDSKVVEAVPGSFDPHDVL